MIAKNNRLFILRFILPGILVLLGIYLYPVLRTISMSFFAVEGPSTPISRWTWAGLSNYVKLLHSKDFVRAYSNSIKYLFVGGALVIGCSILQGVTLSNKAKLPGRNTFKVLIYMPNMISAVAIGYAYTHFVFQEDFGLLTTIWKWFGATPIEWLTGPNKFYAMVVSVVFTGAGYYMMLMTAGIENIPDDLYEAAVLDGANGWQKFIHITLPLMKGTIQTIVTFWSIGAMNMFTWNQVFSPRGLESSTVSPVLLMYGVVFGNSLGDSTGASSETAAGLGAAIGVVTALSVQIIYTLSTKLLKSDDLEF